MNNLALAYADRIRGERAENLERAIHHYTLALEVRTRQADPERWAGTQNNLGLLCLQTNRTEQAKILLARAYLIFTQISSPYAQTAANALIQAFDGSTDAANDYLAQLLEDEEPM